MNSTRKTALVAGIFYLLTEVTAIGGMLSYGRILTDPTFIVSASGNDTGVLIGAFLEVLEAAAARDSGPISWRELDAAADPLPAARSLLRLAPTVPS